MESPDNIPQIPQLIEVIVPPRINCDKTPSCLDYPEKCDGCANNKIAHKFISKT